MSDATGEGQQATGGGTPRPQSRVPFRERLAYYVLGVAIGCMILGVAYSAKQRAARRDAEVERARAAEEQAKAGGAVKAPRGDGK